MNSKSLKQMLIISDIPKKLNIKFNDNINFLKMNNFNYIKKINF